MLFTLVTKEAAAYNSLNIKDTSFLKPRDIVITATADGIVSSVAHQSGEYAQEGDELCTIADPQSMVFVLELPYELHRYAADNDKCIIQLPDGKSLQGYVYSLMPRVDNASQTQNIIIKCPEASNIPENLVATVLLQKSIKQDALLVPREAVLSNESQSEFWVMKMINDSTAVKEIVKPGIRNQDRIELVEPLLKEGNKVLVSGNYGLSDTALVKIAPNPASE